jgi:hypothetical protein
LYHTPAFAHKATNSYNTIPRSPTSKYSNVRVTIFTMKKFQKSAYTPKP